MLSSTIRTELSWGRKGISVIGDFEGTVDVCADVYSSLFGIERKTFQIASYSAISGNVYVQGRYCREVLLNCNRQHQVMKIGVKNRSNLEMFDLLRT